MLEKIRDLMSSDNSNIREKLFVIICLEGIVAALVCLIESISIQAGIGTYIIILSTLGIIPGALISVVNRGGQELPIAVVTIWMNMVVFPMVFFSCGGIYSGSNCWLALGFIYVFLVYRGRPLAVFASATALIDILCYVTAYIHPEYVKPLDTVAGQYTDSLFGVFSVGITAGLIFSYRRRGYTKESSMAIKQRNELDRINESRGRFYANFSHEIRNPINSIIGLNELNIRQTGDEEILKNSQAIGRSGKLLLSIVNDIMDLSQIENNSMQLTKAPYDSRELITGLTELIDTRVRDKGLDLILEIDPDLPAVMIGDKRRIVQVLLNLLTNAVKYTDEGYVKFTVICDRKENKQVKLRILVADSGLGIKKSNMTHLFDTYSQFDRESNSNKEGNGLGLPIAYQLTKLMGGDITVDSVYGSGSVFTMELIQEYTGDEVIGNITYEEITETVSKEASYDRSFEASGARVLIVDDDEQNRGIMRSLLKDTRVKIDEAGSGEEALKYTGLKRYHIIFVDYVMPGMSGTDVLEAIRTQSGGKCTDSVIIALTGAVLEGRVHNKALYDFDRILLKPVEYSVLENVIADNLPTELIEYRKEPEETLRSAPLMTVAKRRRKVRITVDSVCDLPIDVLNSYDIGVIYMHIKAEKGRFLDRQEIDISDLMGKLTSDRFEISPDGCSVSEYEEFFKNELEGADDIIHLSLGSALGLSYGRAAEAAESFAHVHVIDTGQVSAGLGLLAVMASGLAAGNDTVDRMCESIRRLSHYVETSCVLPSSAIFAHYGHMGEKRARLYDSLSIHPDIAVMSGGLRQIRAYRGDMDKVTSRHLRTTMALSGRIDQRAPVIVTHAGLTPRQQDKVMREIKRYVPDRQVMLTKAGVTMASVVGVGTVGIAYLKMNHLKL